MPFSQFTIYKSGDAGAPQLSGRSGSLLNVLNACLVTGYGSKAGAGWLKPIPDDGTGMGCFKQPSGSGYTVFVNDAAPTSSTTAGAGLTREASATGYKYLLGFTGSSYFGSGSDPMPYAGMYVANQQAMGWMKSTTVDVTTASYKNWVVAADAYTFYLFMQPETNTDRSLWTLSLFGDMYSYLRSYDPFKCMIGGRHTICGTTINLGNTDSSGYVWGMGGGQSYPHIIGAKSYTGLGPAQWLRAVGDIGKMNFISNPGYLGTQGLQTGDGLTSNFDISAIQIVESPSGSTNFPLRGEFRGLYQPMVLNYTLADGQMISGSNRFAGRIFMFIGRSEPGGGWLVETTPYVRTN